MRSQESCAGETGQQGAEGMEGAFLRRKRPLARALPRQSSRDRPHVHKGYFTYLAYDISSLHIIVSKTDEETGEAWPGSGHCRWLLLGQSP